MVASGLWLKMGVTCGLWRKRIVAGDARSRCFGSVESAAEVFSAERVACAWGDVCKWKM